MAQSQDELIELVGQLNQRAVAREDRPNAAAESGELSAILSSAVDAGASDVLLVASTAVTQRVNGLLRFTSSAPLRPEDIRAMMLPMLTPAQYAILQKDMSVDFSFKHRSNRIRANLHYQCGELSAALRILPKDIPTMAGLNLPDQLTQLTSRKRGLILITGSAGAGKSSTLAAIIDGINRSRECHIVTVEEPIEYLHSNRKSVVEQIEVGTDTRNFNECLRSLLRQSIDVILVGEMRDPETIALALTAAETGHLILSTLHTNDAAQSISRIVDSVHPAAQAQVRLQLSLCLVAIVSQQLVPSVDGTRRYPACEVLIGTDAVRNLIRQGKDHQVRTQIDVSRSAGMNTMETALLSLVHAGKITRDVALAHSFRQDEMMALLGTYR